MKRIASRGAEKAEITQRRGPLQQKLFFQQLPPDVQLAILLGIKFRLSRGPLPEDRGLFYLDDVLDEEADDVINRHNWKRTIREWIEFAETGT